jgi:hypothetical protein
MKQLSKSFILGFVLVLISILPLHAQTVPNAPGDSMQLQQTQHRPIKHRMTSLKRLPTWFTPVNIRKRNS